MVCFLLRDLVRIFLPGDVIILAAIAFLEHPLVISKLFPCCPLQTCVPVEDSDPDYRTYSSFECSYTGLFQDDTVDCKLEVLCVSASKVALAALAI